MKECFKLQPIPRSNGNYGVELFQGERKLVAVWGAPLQVSMGLLLDMLKRCGYRPTDLRPNRRKPFLLDESSGVRLGLLFLAVKPLRKPSRLETISNAIREMSDEEVYYWFSRCTSNPDARRAQRALRILLSEE